MVTHDPNATGGGLSIEGRRPLVWSPVPILPNAAELLAAAHRNLDTLRPLATLFEPPPERSEDHPALTREIERLDRKLNFILDLLMRERQTRLPPAVSLRFNARYLGFEVADAVAPLQSGTVLRFDLHLDDRQAQPLLLWGIIEPRPGLAPGWAMAHLQGVGDEVTDLIERLIFLEHRRHLADARRARGL